MKYGIICALDTELNDILEATLDVQEHKKGDLIIYTGTVDGKPVVLNKCGVGKVNAARGTQLMIDLFEPDVIVNSGVAGGVGEGLSVGDIIVASDLAQHDFDVSPLGYVRGALCESENKGSITSFVSDEKLNLRLIEAANCVLEKTGDGGKVTRGRIVSGDQFIAGTEIKKMLKEEFGALAAEMEGAAIAQVAYYAGVPFAVLRSVSDLADGSASVSYAEFEIKAAKIAAQIVLTLIRSE